MLAKRKAKKQKNRKNRKPKNRNRKNSSSAIFYFTRFVISELGKAIIRRITEIMFV